MQLSIFGYETPAEFQAAHGLPVTGEWDKPTADRAAEIIRQIQTITAPYTPHPQEPNGVADNYTRAAICRWQLKHNITPDGIARVDTLAAMGIIKEEQHAQ